MSLIWLNGTLIDKADARVSPFDHGFLYGDGVWEHFRLFNGKPFSAEQHLKLLHNSANTLGIDIPLSQTDLLAAIDATAKANNRTEGYVRVIVTRGPGTIGPDPRKLEPQVIVIAEEYQPFPRELYGHGLHAVVSPVPLDLDNPIHQHRTLNQLHVVQAKRYALQNGCLEALYQGGGGYIVGSTEGALFVVKDGNVIVSDWRLEDGMSRVIQQLAGERLTVSERPFEAQPLIRDMDEVFIAGTACGVIGIVRIDNRDIGTGTEGPVTREIRGLYQRLTRGESK